MEFLKKLKIEILYDPAIPLLDIYPNESKSVSQRDICTSMFTAALFTIAKMWKPPKRPLASEWIKKVMHTHTHMHTYSLTQEYFSTTKKQEILPFVTT